MWLVLDAGNHPGRPSSPVCGLYWMQEIIQAGLAALPDDATLDSKLVIQHLTSQGSADTLPPPTGATLSPLELGGQAEDEEAGGEWGDEERLGEECGTLDEMMCGIVDAMPPLDQ